MAKAKSLYLMTETPMPSAMSSSSRMAAQALPTRESLTRTEMNTAKNSKRQDQVVEDSGVAGVESEERNPLGVGDSLRPAQIGLEPVGGHQDADDLTKPESHDGQVVAPETENRRPDDEADRDGDEDGDGNRNPEVGEGVLGRSQRVVGDEVGGVRGQDGRHVGADRVEGDISEVEQAGEPDDDVEPESEEDVKADGSEHIRNEGIDDPGQCHQSDCDEADQHPGQVLLGGPREARERP